MEQTNRLIDYYLPPGEGFVLESLIATTYQVDFEFVEEELLAVAFGVRSPISRIKAFRSELERNLQKAEVSILYDLSGSDGQARLSPRIDTIPIVSRKLHSKISLLKWVRENRVDGEKPDWRIRLIIGSANLTRQGFRQNYECVVSVDFGGRSNSSSALLTTAIGLVQQIASESKSPQLANQLTDFVKQAAFLPSGTKGSDDPFALVAASEVVPTIRNIWAGISKKVPETITVVSPFWAEGTTAAAGLSGLFEKLGPPANLELVCRGETSADGKAWLPVFDSNLAIELKKLLGCRLSLRAALPNTGAQNSSDSGGEIGDETEDQEFANRLINENLTSLETQRSLHAKMILVDGSAGSVLYAGSSNCTRRGLGLGGPTNSEAGFVYRLTPRQRKQVSGLLAFAGPVTEVHADHAPATVEPTNDQHVLVPTFLSEVIATGSVVTIHFRDLVPPDLTLLMPIPARACNSEYWFLHHANPLSENPAGSIILDLKFCHKCDGQLQPIATEPSDRPIQPHVYVEARWKGHSAKFPVRFDDKTQLPLLLAGRKPTEEELIDYFLLGTEPDEGNDDAGFQVDGPKGQKHDMPVDTSRILAYFIRRFVQAIPGIEAEIRRAGYSRVSLVAALKGPTSPLELAERSFASLHPSAAQCELTKTPIAVGFQLTEIVAALIRSKEAIVDSELNRVFDPVIERCRVMLSTIVATHTELQSEGFRLYQSRILGDGP